jgi:GDP-L-fucose synthase
MHRAKINGDPAVTLWGTGRPRREFLFSDDLAEAVRFLLENYDSSEIINVGWGEDISIRELAELVGEIVGYQGSLEFDDSRPDGTPQKLLDTTKIKALGWVPRVRLPEGIRKAYQAYLEQP